MDILNITAQIGFLLFITYLVLKLFYELGRDKGHEEAKGEWAKDSGEQTLKVNEIYEATHIFSKTDTEVFVLIKDRSGKEKIYCLCVKPPAIFKKTDNRDNPYQPYP